MKIILIIVAIAVISAVIVGLGIIVTNTVNNDTQINMKYCETADDCATSCGGKIGRGSSFNRAFISPVNPLDSTCCICDYCAPCMISDCVNNTCTAIRAEGDCC